MPILSRIYLVQISKYKHARRKCTHAMRESGIMGFLESFFRPWTFNYMVREAGIDGEPTDYFPVFLDSGAFSLVQQSFHDLQKARADKDGVIVGADGKRIKLGGSTGFLRGKARTSDIGRLDFSYVKSKAFKKYFEAYIAFVHKHKKRLEVYVNLDVPHNAELSWEHQLYMESCGLQPLPVYHYGESRKWLKRYVDRCGYVGVGGPVVMVKDRYIATVAEPLFDYLYGKDWTHHSDVKLHCFGTTSVEMMLRYPWYSVDSSTWIKEAAYGKIIMPAWKNDKWDFCQWGAVAVSDKALHTPSTLPVHYSYFCPEEQAIVQRWLKHCGETYEEVAHSNVHRGVCNIMFYTEAGKYIRAHVAKPKTWSSQGVIF